MRAQASRAMKVRMATAAKQRTMAGSSPASAWPENRYTPASASTVVVSPAGVSVKAASKAGYRAPSGPIAS